MYKTWSTYIGISYLLTFFCVSNVTSNMPKIEYNFPLGYLLHVHHISAQPINILSIALLTM
jgi:hypothetical protein